jgi:hypothetical protein
VKFVIILKIETYLTYLNAPAMKVFMKYLVKIKVNVSCAKINVRVVSMIELIVQFVLILQIEIKILLLANVKMDLSKTLL